MDFSEIDHVGSHGSTGDLCLKDTGEGGFGRSAPRANLVSSNFEANQHGTIGFTKLLCKDSRL